MEQDTFNMEAVQRGLETTRRPYVIASTAQEGILTWRHDLLSSWVADQSGGECRDCARRRDQTPAQPECVLRRGRRRHRAGDHGQSLGALRPERETYLEGTLFEADPELCVWVSAPRPSGHRPHQSRPRHARRAVTAADRRGHSSGGVAILPRRRPVDAELMFSAYHQDATDDHGVYVGSTSLCDRVVDSHRRYDATMHYVLNHAIEVVDERHASGEVYNVTYLRRTGREGTAYLDTWWGRYLDEYECRDGRWRSAIASACTNGPAANASESRCRSRNSSGKAPGTAVSVVAAEGRLLRSFLHISCCYWRRRAECRW